MVLTRLATALFLLTIPIAGCLENGLTKDVDERLETALGELLAGPSLWDDPQDFPHPKFNWPTLSNPPEGNVPEWWTPIEPSQLPSKVTKLERVGHVEGVDKGAGIAVFGRLAVVPGDGGQSWVVDISDPAEPKVLSNFSSNGRGAAIIAYPTGRLVTVLASSGVIEVVDITNPLEPEILEPIKPTQGSHKLGVVPGTPYVYNAASLGGDPFNPLWWPGPSSVSPSMGTGVTEIFDLTDPEHPIHVQDWKNGYSCHHIFFWNSAEKQRGICAGMQYTQIFDTSDPADPKIIVNVPVHHGVANSPSGMLSIYQFSHSAGMNVRGDILYVGDESMGGLPPGCAASATTPLGEVSSTMGATWFYDIKDEKNPRVLGYYSPTNDPRIKSPAESCTTHHGRLIPVPGRDLLAMSYYGMGVIVVDFTGIGQPMSLLPHVVAQYADGSNTWETWYDQGYLVTGDLSRGLDMIKIE